MTVFPPPTQPDALLSSQAASEGASRPQHRTQMAFLQA